MSDPLAAPADLGVYLGKDISADDPRAVLLLQLAHDRCEMYVSPVPAAAKGIELSVAARVYTNATNAHQVGLGSGNVSFGAQNSSTGIGGLYVSRQEQRELRKMAGRTGAFTIDLLPVSVAPTAAPVLTDVTPDGAVSGALVQVAGYWLTGTVSVTIGGVSAKFLVVDDATVDVVIPVGTAGTVDVVATNAIGPSSSLPYERG